MNVLTLNDGRDELWQWDTGRTLIVDPDCSQVHFRKNVFDRSIDVDVVNGVAIIPDVLLQTDKDLTVWAFSGTAENGYTKIRKTFKVNRRNKPADYVFTPPDQTSLEEIKERVDYLESMQDPDAIKNAVNDYLEQNPVEAPVQSVNGKTGAVELNAEDVGAIAKTELQTTINTALAQAKESGEFDGADGAPGPQGPHGETGPKGDTGPEGEAGGYYTPAVTQPDANTMRLSFSPSKDGMTAVSETDITLPSGGSGSVAVDSTLTVSGQAADAKAVGDAINRVNSAIEAKQDHLTEQDKQEIVLTGITTYSWTDEERKAVSGRLTIIKNSLDTGIAVAGAQYYLGERKTVSIVLPDDAGAGDMITVSWYNGDTAATLSITGTILSFDYTPSANTRSEINALRDGRYWAVLGNEMAVPSEVTT